MSSKQLYNRLVIRVNWIYTELNERSKRYLDGATFKKEKACKSASSLHIRHMRTKSSSKTAAGQGHLSLSTSNKTRQ